jgi:hypothetical protein
MRNAEERIRAGKDKLYTLVELVFSDIRVIGRVERN